jgi:hypothetical protein
MLACHGQEGHAFRVYSPGKLRLVPGATLAARDAPLGLAEAQANFASMRGLANANQPDASPLLRKPLAPGLGGGEHVGGVIFRSTDDPAYAALYAWLSGETSNGCALLDQIKKNP